MSTINSRISRMKTIRTNDILTQEIWHNMVEERRHNPRYYQGHATYKPDRLIHSNTSIAPINKFAKKHHSQYGSEGIVEHILNKIGHTSKVCVELGANDGKKLSNTLYFKNQYKFRRILIEGNPSIKNVTNDKIIYEIITIENINSLLASAQCPEVCEYISIDFDGDDFWVWEAMNVKAKVVIVEYQASIPNDLPLVIKPGQGAVHPKKDLIQVLDGYFLANLHAFYILAEKLGYKFATTIGVNAIFVLNEEFLKIGIPEVSLEECLERYMILQPYWYKYKDKHNREWIIYE